MRILALAALLAFTASADARPRSERRPRRERLVRIEGSALSGELQPRPGRALLVHLWASWCHPCVVEWPSLARLARAYKRRALDVVTVALDETETVPAAARIFKKSRLPHAVRTIHVPIAEVSATVRRLDPQWDGAIPTTFVFDADGRLALAHRGATGFRDLARTLERVAPRASRQGKHASKKPPPEEEDLDHAPVEIIR